MTVISARHGASLCFVVLFACSCECLVHLGNVHIRVQKHGAACMHICLIISLFSLNINATSLWLPARFCLNYSYNTSSADDISPTISESLDSSRTSSLPGVKTKRLFVTGKRFVPFICFDHPHSLLFCSFSFCLLL